MASIVLDYGANFFLGQLFGGYYERPDHFYIALVSKAPSASSTGGTLAEPLFQSTGNRTDYQRLSVPNSSDYWGAPEAGTMANTRELTWPVATTNWGLITGYVLTDDLTTGNCYVSGTLSVPHYMEAGKQFRFPAGAFVFAVSSLQKSIVA